MKKRITIENRIVIEELLRMNFKLKDIAHALGKHPSTISREIKKRRITGKGIFKECEKTQRFPYVCNGCSNKTYCRKKNIIITILKLKRIITIFLNFLELA